MVKKKEEEILIGSYLNIGEIIVIELDRVDFPQTRSKSLKLQCSHNNGDWEDTPELKDGEVLCCKIGDKLRVVKK